jgi:hypothetical protein
MVEFCTVKLTINSETILEELAFNYDKVSPTDLQWRCVE